MNERSTAFRSTDVSGRTCGQALGPAASGASGYSNRTLMAIGLAGGIAAVLRLRGSGGTPPQQGGWRELTPEELR